MPGMHLKLPEFIHGACGPFFKITGRIQKLNKTNNSRNIYQN